MFSYKIWKFKEKSRSLQNQPNRMELPAEQSLEFLMYGPNAVKYNEFKHSQVINLEFRTLVLCLKFFGFFIEKIKS